MSINIFRTEKGEEKGTRTTLPGLKLLRLHVLVSVVQQLKHLRRTRSLSFIAASSVCTIGIPAMLLPALPCDSGIGGRIIVPGIG
jgi:hypothetical protein